MNNEEKILQLLTAINSKVDRIASELEEIKEVQEEHTSCLNKLIEWTEVAAVTIRVPFMEPKLPE